MKVFSFSIYGCNPIYTIGGIKNAKLVADIFPDWKAVFYIADNVDKEVVNKIIDLGGLVEIMDSAESFSGMFWRFKAISRTDVDLMEVRDCDSRISERDFFSIEEFIKSDKQYHILRDHPLGHYHRINGGMWGCKKNEFIMEIDKLINEYLKNNYSHVFNTDAARHDTIRNADQIFLADVLYPVFQKDSIVHDEYFKYEAHSKPINHDRKQNDFAFIGESVDENDIPRGDQRKDIKRIYENKLLNNGL
jgi:hypothetical protein